MEKLSSRKFSRKQNIRSEYRIIYIFAEGQKTEVNYFKSKKEEIRKTNIKIKIKGTAFNTLSLVDYALDFINGENISLTNSDKSDECWVVFDKDDFNTNFDKAINKALKNNIKVAYSNECFELWFLLHFNLLTSAIDRRDYVDKLNVEIKKMNGEKYEKNSKIMHPLLKHLESNAIKNAQKLLQMHDSEKTYSKKNPSTTVHLLVESLNKLK